jgi:hypothetical protein
MIEALVFVGEGTLDDQPYVFPALPAVGTVLRVRDRDGDRHDLEVRCVDMDAAQLHDAEHGVPLQIRLYCNAV